MPLYRWPEPYRSAVALTFDVDAETGLASLGCDLATHPSAASHQAYGPTVGMPRLLGLLIERGLRATFFIPGATAERYPGTVEAICEAGHEVGHHGYDHEPLVEMSLASERAVLERGLEALEKVGAGIPVGYRAPWLEWSEATGALLVEYGFGYDSSLFGADHPYLIEEGRLVEVPVSWALDDWERYAFWPGVTGSGLIQRPSALAADWSEEIRATSAVGGVSVLTMHPFLTGRPSRAAALGGLLDELADASDLWFAPLGEIAAWTRATIDAPPAS